MYTDRRNKFHGSVDKNQKNDSSWSSQAFEARSSYPTLDNMTDGNPQDKPLSQ